MFLHALVLLSYLAIGSALLLAMTIAVICFRPEVNDAPKSNLGYWGPKLARNKQRDVDTLTAVRAAGCKAAQSSRTGPSFRSLYAIFWECGTGDLT
jgi:hypothetical protein